ncbi:MAG: DUF3179 domain-containing protein [Gemmatimonadetes bacterium]|nr:DUF3179 domain-containing protein [Gemmatimonadota bacterium]
MTDRKKVSLGRAGAVFFLLFVLIIAAVFYRLIPVLEQSTNVSGADEPFDLSGALVPVDEIVDAGFGRDGLKAMDLPAVQSREEIDALAEKRRGKYLVGGDRVIGVLVAGAARAYPIDVLNWHEIVNDTLGGRPIAVTYSPLTDAVGVYDRNVGAETLVFGVSGKVHDSNLMMFDRRDRVPDESLWSQLQGKALAGTMAGTELATIPAAYTTWGDWVRWNPQTTVIERDPALYDMYKKRPYGTYYGSQRLRFPAQPLPPPEGIPLKSSIVAVPSGAGAVVLPVDEIARAAGPDGKWEREIDGRSYRFEYEGRPPRVTVRDAGTDRLANVRYALWFAWHAQYPGDSLFTF